MLSNCAVSWKSKKQTVIALSTAEAEYIALSAATQEVSWMRKLLDDLGLKCSGPTSMMVADVLTKPVYQETFQRLRSRMGLTPQIVN